MLPLTSMSVLFGINSVALVIDTTQGTPSSQLTITAWLIWPRASTTTAALDMNSGVQIGSVEGQPECRPAVGHQVRPDQGPHGRCHGPRRANRGSRGGCRRPPLAPFGLSFNERACERMRITNIRVFSIKKLKHQVTMIVADTQFAKCHSCLMEYSNNGGLGALAVRHHRRHAKPAVPLSPTWQTNGRLKPRL